MNTAEYAVIVPYTKPPPVRDMMDAAGWMICACARTMGRAKPVTTTQEVMYRPKSIMGDVVSYSALKSEERAHALDMALGTGARRNVKAGRGARRETERTWGVC